MALREYFVERLPSCAKISDNSSEATAGKSCTCADLDTVSASDGPLPSRGTLPRVRHPPEALRGLVGISKIELRTAHSPAHPSSVPDENLSMTLRVIVGGGEARQEVLALSPTLLVAKKDTDQAVVRRALGWVFRCSDLNVQHLVVTVEAKPTSGVASMAVVPLRYLPRNTPVVKTFLLGGFMLALRLETRPCIPPDPTQPAPIGAPIGCRLSTVLSGLFHRAICRGPGRVTPIRDEAGVSNSGGKKPGTRLAWSSLTQRQLLQDGKTK